MLQFNRMWICITVGLNSDVRTVLPFSTVVYVLHQNEKLRKNSFRISERFSSSPVPRRKKDKRYITTSYTHVHTHIARSGVMLVKCGRSLLGGYYVRHRIRSSRIVLGEGRTLSTGSNAAADIYARHRSQCRKCHLDNIFLSHVLLSGLFQLTRS